jgi:hypothetical protein
MDSGNSSQPSWTWSASQRRVLVVFLAILCISFSIRRGCNRTYVSDPPPVRGPRYDEVMDRIDPDTADVSTLSALPMIGEKRAQDIYDFREARRVKRPGERVFNKPEDLLLIRGFGRATIELLRPHLMFPVPATSTSTQPNL